MARRDTSELFSSLLVVPFSSHGRGRIAIVAPSKRNHKRHPHHTIKRARERRRNKYIARERRPQKLTAQKKSPLEHHARTVLPGQRGDITKHLLDTFALPCVDTRKHLDDFESHRSHGEISRSYFLMRRCRMRSPAFCHFLCVRAKQPPAHNDASIAARTIASFPLMSLSPIIWC